MPTLYRKWYTVGVTYYTQIFDEAIGNYGIITSSKAKEMGIPIVELVKLSKRGRLRRLGYGVYKLVQYSPAPDGLDAYADSLALVGKDAYLYAQSVLAMHHLCPTNPARIYIGTPNRCRKRLGVGIIVADCRPCEELEWYDGIPSQTVADAILASRGTIMEERLAEAIATALDNDLIDKQTAVSIRRKISREQAAKQ